MMMPANFSAIAETEMTYVVGGGLEDYLAPVMTASNWQTFNKNLITIIGNTYMKSYVNGTLGVIFSGSYVPGNITKGYAGVLSTIWSNNTVDASFNPVRSYGKGILNVALDIVGNLAAIYTLGNGTVNKVYTTSF